MVRIYEQQADLAPPSGRRQQLRDEVAIAKEGVAQGVGRAGAGVGGALDDVGQKMMAEQHDAAIKEAYSSLGAVGDNLQSGLLNKKGKAALDDRDNVLRLWDERATQVKKDIPPPARRAYEALVLQERAKFARAVDSYVGQENRAYIAQVHEAAVDTARNQALGAAARSDPAALMQAIGTAHQVINAGHDPDEVKALKKAAATTEGHLAMVESVMLGGNTTLARQYLDAHRSLLDEGLVAKSGIDKRLTAATVRDRGRALSDEVWAAADGDPLKAAELLRAKNISETELFDEASKRIQERATQADALRREADDPRLGRLEQQMRMPSKYGEFSTQSDDYVRLSDEGKATILRWRDAERREARREQAEIDANAAAHFGARPLYGQTGADQVSVDIKREYADASARQRDKLTAQQQEIAKLGERSVTIEEINRRATAEAKALRLKGRKAAELQLYIQDQVREWAADPKNQGRKNPPPDEVDRWFRQGLLRGETPGTFYGTNELYGFEAARQGKPFTPLVQQPDRPTQDTPGGGRAPPQAAGVKLPTDKVRVRKADGTTGTVPAANVAGFLAANPGATVVE